jgi:hypothetical protein
MDCWHDELAQTTAIKKGSPMSMSCVRAILITAFGSRSGDSRQALEHVHQKAVSLGCLEVTPIVGVEPATGGIYSFMVAPTEEHFWATEEEEAHKALLEWLEAVIDPALSMIRYAEVRFNGILGRVDVQRHFGDDCVSSIQRDVRELTL